MPTPYSQVPNDTSNYTAEMVCVFMPSEGWDMAFSSSLFFVGYAIPGLLMFYFYAKVPSLPSI